MARKILLAFVLWMAFAFGFLRSIIVAVGWWKGELNAGPREWLWIGLLSVWIFVFFRYYSIFRPGCRARCLPEHDPLHRQAGPGAP